MAVTLKQLQEELEGHLTPAEKAEKEAQLLQDVQRRARELQDFIDALRRMGKGIEWSDEVEGWLVTDVPGINSRLQPAKKRPDPLAPITSNL